jgi:hypothetical protein
MASAYPRPVQGIAVQDPDVIEVPCDEARAPLNDERIAAIRLRILVIFPDPEDKLVVVNQLLYLVWITGERFGDLLRFSAGKSHEFVGITCHVGALLSLCVSVPSPDRIIVGAVQRGCEAGRSQQATIRVAHR